MSARSDAGARAEDRGGRSNEDPDGNQIPIYVHIPTNSHSTPSNYSPYRPAGRKNISGKPGDGANDEGFQDEDKSQGSEPSTGWRNDDAVQDEDNSQLSDESSTGWRDDDAVQDKDNIQNAEHFDWADDEGPQGNDDPNVEAEDAVPTKSNNGSREKSKEKAEGTGDPDVQGTKTKDEKDEYPKVKIKRRKYPYKRSGSNTSFRPPRRHGYAYSGNSRPPIMDPYRGEPLASMVPYSQPFPFPPAGGGSYFGSTQPDPFHYGPYAVPTRAHPYMPGYPQQPPPGPANVSTRPDGGQVPNGAPPDAFQGHYGYGYGLPPHMPQYLGQYPPPPPPTEPPTKPEEPVAPDEKRDSAELERIKAEIRELVEKRRCDEERTVRLKLESLEALETELRKETERRQAAENTRQEVERAATETLERAEAERIAEEQRRQHAAEVARRVEREMQEKMRADEMARLEAKKRADNERERMLEELRATVRSEEEIRRRLEAEREVLFAKTKEEASAAARRELDEENRRLDLRRTELDLQRQTRALELKKVEAERETLRDERQKLELQRARWQAPPPPGYTAPPRIRFRLSGSKERSGRNTLRQRTSSSRKSTNRGEKILISSLASSSDEYSSSSSGDDTSIEESSEEDDAHASTAAKTRVRSIERLRPRRSPSTVSSTSSSESNDSEKSLSSTMEWKKRGRRKCSASQSRGLTMRRERSGSFKFLLQAERLFSVVWSPMSLVFCFGVVLGILLLLMVGQRYRFRLEDGEEDDIAIGADDLYV